MASGIYQIRNQINGKRYIGSAVNLKRRWQQHLAILRRGRHFNFHLQAAFDKYGETTFIFVILESFEDASQLIICEQYYLDMLNPEYNISPTAGNTLGFRHSEATKCKLGALKTGEQNPNYGKHPHNYGKHPSEETRAKMREAHRGERHHMYGKHHSTEAIRKMSRANSGEQHPNYGKQLSAETCAKISEANTGKHHSEKAKQRMRAAWTPERRQAQSDRQQGKHRSEDTLAKMREAQRARRQRESEE